MSTTPRFGLTEMAESQSSKYITFNDLMAAFDALVGCTVLDRDLTSPPTSPTASDGDCYLVATTGSGDWTGQTGKLAQMYNGAWRFYTLPSGFVYWVDDESTEVRVA